MRLGISSVRQVGDELAEEIAGGRPYRDLEDETGLVNVILSKGVWTRFRRIARSASAMVIRGKLEKAEGTLNVVAERLEDLPLSMATKSRDFR